MQPNAQQKFRIALFLLAIAAAVGAALFQWVALPHVFNALPPSKITTNFLQMVAFVRFFLLGLAAFAAAAGVLSIVKPGWVNVRVWVVASLLLAGLIRLTAVDDAIDHVPRPDGVHFSAAAASLLSEPSWRVETGPWRLPARTLPGASFIMCLTQWMAPRTLGLGIYAVWFFAVLGLLLAYRLGERLFSPTAGVIAVLLVATSPLHGHYSRQLMSDVPWGTLVLATLYLLLVPPVTAPRVAAAGLLAGLGLLFKSSHLLIAAAFLIFVLGSAARTRNWKHAALFAMAVLLGALPALLYNRFVLGGWLTTPYHLYWPGWTNPAEAVNLKYLWSPPLIKGSLGNVPYYLLAFGGLDPRFEKMPWALPVALLFFAALVLRRHGAAQPIPDEGRRFLHCLGLLGLFYGGACMLYSFQDPRFFLPILPAAAIAAALPISRLVERLPREAVRLLAVLTLIATLAAAAAFPLSAAARPGPHERELWSRLRQAVEKYDVLVTDEDPVLLTYAGVWNERTRIYPLLLEGEVWFPADPERLFREKGVVVAPFEGTLNTVNRLLADGRRIAVWIRRPHERPQAYRQFIDAFILRTLPESGVPGLQEIVPPQEFETAPASPPAQPPAPAAAVEAPMTKPPLAAPTRRRVNGGRFMLGGRGPPETDAQNRSLPEHEIIVSDFQVDATEVANAAYAEFLNEEFGRGALTVIDNGSVREVRLSATNGAGPVLCRIDSSGLQTHLAYDAADANAPFRVLDRKPADAADHPVVNVTWYGAAAFCNWKSGKDGVTPAYVATTNTSWPTVAGANGYRLPTDAEWEMAAAWDGSRKRMFPFGDQWDDRRANAIETPPEERASFGPATMSVTSHGPENPDTSGASPCGALNMAGNVWEWCQDWYSDYPKETRIDPLGPATGTIKVVRGGSFRSEPAVAWCAYRGILDPSLSLPDLGFRTVRPTR